MAPTKAHQLKNARRRATELGHELTRFQTSRLNPQLLVASCKRCGQRAFVVATSWTPYRYEGYAVERPCATACPAHEGPCDPVTTPPNPPTTEAGEERPSVGECRFCGQAVAR